MNSIFLHRKNLHCSSFWHRIYEIIGYGRFCSKYYERCTVVTSQPGWNGRVKYQFRFLSLCNTCQLSSWFILPYSHRTCSHPNHADEKITSVYNFVNFSEALHKTKFHPLLGDSSITVCNWNLFEAFDFVAIASNANACHQKLQNHFSLVLLHLLYQSFQIIQNQILLFSTCTYSMPLNSECKWSNRHNYLHHHKWQTKYHTVDFLEPSQALYKIQKNQHSLFK